MKTETIQITNLILKNNSNRLIELKNQNPELIFNNNGYERLPKETQEKYKEQIKEIENILKQFGYVSPNFKNFKPRKNGSFDIRFDAYWDNSFKGVYYVPLEEFKNNII